MNNKTSIYDKIVKHVFGIQQFDEYKKAKIERIGNLFFIIIWFGLPIEVLIGFIFGSFWPVNTLFTILFVNFIFCLLCNIYIFYYINKYKLDENDIDSKNTGKEIMKIIIKTIGSILFFLTFMSVLFIICYAFFNHENLLAGFKDYLHYDFLKIIKEDIILSIFILIYQLFKTKRFK